MAELSERDRQLVEIRQEVRRAFEDFKRLQDLYKRNDQLIRTWLSDTVAKELEDTLHWVSVSSAKPSVHPTGREVRVDLPIDEPSSSQLRLGRKFIYIIEVVGNRPGQYVAIRKTSPPITPDAAYRPDDYVETPIGEVRVVNGMVVIGDEPGWSWSQDLADAFIRFLRESR